MIKRKFNPMDPEEEAQDIQDATSYPEEEEYEYEYEEGYEEEQYSEIRAISETDAFNLSDIDQFSSHIQERNHENPHHGAQQAPPASLLETKPKPQAPKAEKKEIYTESRKSASSKLGLWAVIITVAIILGGVFLVYFLNDRGSGVNAISGTAIIRSDPVEWKVRPSDPGGKTMPFEDLTILNPSESNEILQQHVDHLLSTSETEVSDNPQTQTQTQTQDQSVMDILDENTNEQAILELEPTSEPEAPILNLEDVLRQNQ